MDKGEVEMMHSTPGDQERKQRILDNSLESLRRLHGDQTWEDWLIVGEAMMIITEDAAITVGAPKWDPDNKRLVREFNARWDEHERKAGSNHKPISKQERWALREVMTRPEIGAWRATLPGNIKRRFNHPNAVINKWRSITREREWAAKGADKPLSKAQQTTQELAKALEEIDRLKRADGSLFDIRRDKPEDIGRVIADTISEPRFKQITTAAIKHYKAKSRPAG
jgi:hypothetical protein